MNATPKKIPTANRVTAADIAGWMLAIFPFSTLLALTLWGDWLIPCIGKYFG